MILLIEKPEKLGWLNLGKTVSKEFLGRFFFTQAPTFRKQG